MSDTVTMTLTEFLLARIAEDEADARQIDYDPFIARMAVGMFAGDHPLRLLAECEAKRQIVAACTRHYADDRAEYTDAPYLAEDALEALAAVYADHPDYDEAWRPWARPAP